MIDTPIFVQDFESPCQRKWLLTEVTFKGRDSKKNRVAALSYPIAKVSFDAFSFNSTTEIKTIFIKFKSLWYNIVVDRIRQTAILFSQLEFVIDWHFFVEIMNRRSSVASGSANIHLICGSLVVFCNPWCLSIALLLKYVYFMNLHVNFGMCLVGFCRWSLSVSFWFVILKNNFLIFVSFWLNRSQRKMSGNLHWRPARQLWIWRNMWTKPCLICIMWLTLMETLR